MATLANVIAFARTQAQTDSNGLTDANGITYGNEALLDFHRRLIAAGVDASQLQEAYMDASVPTAGNGSTFLYPTDMFWLKSIEVNFANATATDYKLATQVDVANLPAEQSFSYLRVNGSTETPQFDDRGDWFEIFPAFISGNNLSQAIRIFYYLEPTEFTVTGDTISYPASLDYRILAYRIAASYKESLMDFEAAESFNTRYEERVTQLIATLSRGSQQPIKATVWQDTGWQY